MEERGSVLLYDKVEKVRNAAQHGRRVRAIF